MLRESILAPLSFPAWPCPDGWEAFLAANLSCPVFPYTMSMGEGSQRPMAAKEGIYFLHTRCTPSSSMAREESPYTCEDIDCCQP